jgi:hypothetical protein
MTQENESTLKQAILNVDVRDFNFACVAGLSGFATPVRIKGQDISMLLPIVPNNPQNYESLLNPLTKKDGPQDIIWGQVTGWNSGVDDQMIPTSFELNQVVWISEVKDGLSEGIRQDAEEWLRLFASWVSALTFGTSPHRGAGVEYTDIHIDHHYLLDGVLTSTPGGHSIHIRGNVGTPIPGDIWYQAALQANSRAVIPTQYGMVASAFQAILSDDYRRAVLDAATAVEIALSVEREQILETLSGPVRSFVAEKSKSDGLGSLVGNLKKLGYKDLPTGMNKGVIDPRGHAIHEGVMPSREEAGNAYNLAVEIISKSTPITRL